MKLTCINSNSKGNAYILHNGEEALLLECGVRFDEIKKALQFNLKKVVGCLITHEHQDHCKSVHNVLGAGIPVWSSHGTHEAMQTTGHHRARFVHAEHMVQMGGFRVKAYNVKHDAAQPFCYLINHPDCGTVLFLTDSYYCEYDFKGLNHVIIEANYSQEILDRRLKDGLNPKFLRDRVITSHMSLDTCIKTLQAYDLSQVLNIVLIHLSDSNSNEEDFKAKVQRATGKMVHVAEPWVSIDFKKNPY